MNCEEGDMAIIFGHPIESNNGKMVVCEKILKKDLRKGIFKVRPKTKMPVWVVDREITHPVIQKATGKRIGHMLFNVVCDKYLTPIRPTAEEQDLENASITKPQKTE